METRSFTNKVKSLNGPNVFLELFEKVHLVINKTDITNDLLWSLIEVCRETIPGQRQFSTARSETFDEEESSLKTALIDENEVFSYTSPTQLIQRKINELALHRRVKN